MESGARTAELQMPPAISKWKLSELNRRRLSNFKRNRRGYWSLWIFLALFLLALPAEFIANDKPLLVSYVSEWYLPVLFSHSERTCGGDLGREAECGDT